MIGKYLIFVPEVTGKFSEEWRQCLKQIIYGREVLASVFFIPIQEMKPEQLSIR
jgi:hypothetical protein